MDQERAVEAFAALAQASRMTISRLLVRMGPDGLRAGEIARKLDIVPSTLSRHLSVPRRAGLLASTRRLHASAFVRQPHLTNQRFMYS